MGKSHFLPAEPCPTNLIAWVSSVDQLGIPAWTSLILSRPDTTWPSAETPGQQAATWHPAVPEGRRFHFTAHCHRKNAAWTLHFPSPSPRAAPGNVRQASNLATRASSPKGPLGHHRPVPPISFTACGPASLKSLRHLSHVDQAAKERSEHWICECQVANILWQTAAHKPRGETGLTSLNKFTHALNGGVCNPLNIRGKPRGKHLFL